MSAKFLPSWLAMLTPTLGLAAGCTGGVEIAGTGGSGVSSTDPSSTSATSSGGASTSSSSSTSGTMSTSTMSMSTSTSSGAGGAPTCGFDTPSLCACPSSAGIPWLTDLSAGVASMKTFPLIAGAAQVALDGTMTLGTTTTGGAMVIDSRLTKLDAAGKVVWEKVNTSPSTTFPWLASAPHPGDCGTVIAGSIDAAQAEVLGQSVTCSTAHCPVVARLGPDGALTWIKVYDFGAGGAVWPRFLRVTIDGRITLIGSYRGAIDFGNGPLTSVQSAGASAFVVKLGPDGSELWSRHFDIESYSLDALDLGASVSPSGDVAVTVDAVGAVDFGGFAIDPGPGASGVLAAYDAGGTLQFGTLWSHAQAWPYRLRVAHDPAGNIVVTTILKGALDFGGGLVGTMDKLTMVAASFDPTGAFRWSTPFLDLPQDAYSAGVAVDAATGHVWAGGGTSLVELAPDGTLLATTQLGGSGLRSAHALGFTPSGAHVVVGTFADTVDIGQAPLAAQTNRDVFVSAVGP